MPSSCDAVAPGQTDNPENQCAGRGLPKPEEFLQRWRVKSSQCLLNIYLGDHPIHRSRNGELFTALCTEVFCLFNMQTSAMRDFLSLSGLLSTEEAEALVTNILRFMVQNLKYKQQHFRDHFLLDVESCCAASNDFFRMMELAEELRLDDLNLLLEGSPRSAVSHLLEKEVKDLLSLYSADAVIASHAVSGFVFEPICYSLEQKLFGKEWEDSLHQNEVARSIVCTIDDFWVDVKEYLGHEFLLKKFADSLVMRTVVFYTRCLLGKAKHRQRRNMRSGCFSDPKRALRRIHGDIHVLRNYFTRLTPMMPALSHVIEREFSALVAIHECMSIAAGASKTEEIVDFVIILHKLTGDFAVTRKLLCDLCYLVAPGMEQIAWLAVTSMKTELSEVKEAGKRHVSNHPIEHHELLGMHLDNMLLQFYTQKGKCMHREEFRGKLAVNLKTAREIINALKPRPFQRCKAEIPTSNFVRNKRERFNAVDWCCWQDCTV